MATEAIETGGPIAPVDSHVQNLGPVYSSEVRQRVVNARAKARGSKRRAWRLGPASPTGERHYFVGSYSQLRLKDRKAKGDEEEGYIVTARTHMRSGGYVYSLGLREPVFVWIRCECKASTIPVPCVHGARVQLRLEREWVEEQRQARTQVEHAEKVVEETQVKEVLLWSE